MPLTKTRFLLPSTIQLLRFHFSFFLMPVYWFALSQVPDVNLSSAVLVFFILHGLVYPASNGYNSYMDRDTESIGGIKQPLQPSRQLLYVTALMDCIAIMISCFVSLYFALGILLYILVSKAYSYRGIRLKKYPVAGYLTVILFQGAFTFALVYYGCSMDKTTQVPVPAMLAASLLIGGFYPLTQIYQHSADLRDGVKTISYRLGYRGTFIYCGIIYTIAFLVLGFHFFYTLQNSAFYLFSLCMLPVVLYFLLWAQKVWQNDAQADYPHTMCMNIIASACTNTAFIIIFIINNLE
ncbi:UbiA family prenyltransferase [Agriterribacter sp.]|uniref:UbiA family prenyltransferase n=1 Tax=Agriterribacter sp. TaxID=2821509 RepID=UPI002CB12A1A|nr:UbiA family prenyltransferase [Agriterribacter sp.]HRO44319.1 UbiA family prenyltransferase [Agriterribacter sp.]HRQ16635.1 UbiA family prenyltransferase [Agriterribacter sp.]